jgi:hypothetical protein
MLELVFNELSLCPNTPKDKYKAREWMSEFIGLLKIASESACQNKFVILTDRSFKDMELMQNYFVTQWLSDVSKDQRDAFLAFATQKSYTPDLKYEFKYLKRIKVIGLGHAYLRNAICISLCSRAVFNRESATHIRLTKLELIGDGTAVDIDHACDTFHASNARHFDKFRLRWNGSSKHRKGGHGTELDLDKETAQRVLNCSIQLDGDNQRYGYHNQKLYEFQPDNVGGYHGYPIEMSDLRQAGKHQEVLELLRKSNIITETEYNSWVG